MSHSYCSRSKDLEDVVAQTLNDVENLEAQIRNLLGSMDVTDNIINAPSSVLPQPTTSKEVQPAPSTRMVWHAPEDSTKQRKGKTMPKLNPSTARDNDVGGEEAVNLSDLEIMEMCINEKTAKYIPLLDSAFFVPVLDRCVFGITLLNAAAGTLPKPQLSLSLLQPLISTEMPLQRKPMCFNYDVQVNIKEKDVENIDLRKTEQGLANQDLFFKYLDLTGNVMPGQEVLVTATFPYPLEFLRDSSDFSLLLSVYLNGKELWAREFSITNSSFTAASIDHVFKTHHTSLIAALGTEHQIFKIERLSSKNEMTPYKSMERFLLPLGYEKIQSVRTGSDTIIDCYTTHQPSLLWGSCFKIEKCSKSPSAIRCLVTARAKEQMAHVFTQFQSWLKTEQCMDLGSTRIVISRIIAKNNLSVCETLQAEIDLIVKFLKMKSTLNKERDSEHGRTSKRKADRLNDVCNIDSRFIYEYSICVEKTDTTFVNRVQ